MNAPWEPILWPVPFVNRRPQATRRSPFVCAVYYLEVCIFNQICENGHELFDLRYGEKFDCRLSFDGFSEMKRMLLEAPDWSAAQGGQDSGGCADWCSVWTVRG